MNKFKIGHRVSVYDMFMVDDYMEKWLQHDKSCFKVLCEEISKIKKDKEDNFNRGDFVYHEKLGIGKITHIHMDELMNSCVTKCTLEDRVKVKFNNYETYVGFEDVRKLNIKIEE